MRVYFVRHGQSISNAKRIHQKSNTPLSELGIKQAQLTAEKLSHLEIDILVTSPIFRTLETANIINNTLNKKITISDLFRERKNPSEIEDLVITDHKAIEIKRSIKQHYEIPSWHFSDEENFFDLRKRALRAKGYLQELPYQNVVVVSHNTFITMLTATLLFGGKISPYMFLKFKSHTYKNNAGITIWEFSKNRWKLITWNDMSHLKNV